MNNQRLFNLFLLFIFVLLFSACTVASQATVQPTDTALPPTPTPTPLPPSPDIGPLLQMDISGGDAEQGFNVAIAHDCRSCHNSSSRPDRAPHLGTEQDMLPIMERAEQRIADPAYEGQATTSREYIIESIFIPQAYAAPGEWKVEMPIDYAENLSDEELIHLMAWLASFSEGETAE